MFEKAKPARDAFKLSLGGITTIASFVAAPAVADDRIDRARYDRFNRLRDQVDHLDVQVEVQQERGIKNHSRRSRSLRMP